MVLNDYIERKSLYYDFKSGLKLSKAKIADVMPIANNMRMSDEKECAMVGNEPFDSLMHPIIEHPDETYTISIGNTPLAMCGTGHLDGSLNDAVIWGLGTNDINKNFRAYIRSSIPIVNYMQADYDYVMNLVPSDNYRTISWLKYCKFEFSTEKKIYNGYELLSFYRCNKFKSSIYNESSRPVMH